MSFKDLFSSFGGTRHSSESNFRKKKTEKFQHLSTLATDEQYQSALETMQRNADEEIFQAFCTIIDTLLEEQSPVIRVFLVTASQTFGAHQQILDQMNAQGRRVIPTGTPQQCDVILLFCPALSRVGTDVEAAVKKIPDGTEGKPVILILMHHTRDPEMVPNQTLWREKFRRITDEVRVLFHQTKHGLLDCSMNQEAVHTLQRICGGFTNHPQKKRQRLDDSYDIIGKDEIESVRDDECPENDKDLNETAQDNWVRMANDPLIFYPDQA